jgi:hypothetical protein
MPEDQDLDVLGRAASGEQSVPHSRWRGRRSARQVACKNLRGGSSPTRPRPAPDRGGPADLGRAAIGGYARACTETPSLSNRARVRFRRPTFMICDSRIPVGLVPAGPDSTSARIVVVTRLLPLLDQMPPVCGRSGRPPAPTRRVVPRPGHEKHRRALRTTGSCGAQTRLYPASRAVPRRAPNLPGRSDRGGIGPACTPIRQRNPLIRVSYLRPRTTGHPGGN